MIRLSDMSDDEVENSDSTTDEIIKKLNPILTKYTLEQVINALFEINHGVLGQLTNKDDLELVMTTMMRVLGDTSELVLTRIAKKVRDGEAQFEFDTPGVVQ